MFFLSRISLIISQKNKSNKMCPGNCRIPSYSGEGTESQSWHIVFDVVIKQLITLWPPFKYWNAPVCPKWLILGQVNLSGILRPLAFLHNIFQLLSKEQLGGAKFSVPATLCTLFLILSGLQLAENSLALYHTGVVGWWKVCSNIILQEPK